MIIRRDFSVYKILDIDGIKIEDINDAKYSEILSCMRATSIESYLFYLEVDSKLKNYDDLGYCDQCGTYSHEVSGEWNGVFLSYSESCFEHGYNWDISDEQMLEVIKGVLGGMDRIASINMIVESEAIWLLDEPDGNIEVLEMGV